MVRSGLDILRDHAASLKGFSRRWNYVGTPKETKTHINPKDKIPLGTCVSPKKTKSGVWVPIHHHNKIFHMSLNNPTCRIIIRGATGSGKTMTLLRILPYLYFDYSMTPNILIDPKSEFNFCKSSAPLLPGEKPQIIPSQKFKPSFISGDDENVKNEYRMGVHKFTAPEIMAMKFKRNPPYGINSVMSRSVKEAKSLYGKEYTIDQLIGCITVCVGDDVSKNKAAIIVDDFSSINRVFFNKTNHDILDIMKRRIVPIFQYDMKHDYDEALTSNFVSALIRQIFHAKGNKSKSSPLDGIRPLLVIDEVRLIAPPKKDTPSKGSLIQSSNVGRGLNISLIIASQQLSIIDYTIIEQASHIISYGKLGIDAKVLAAHGMPAWKINQIDQICKVDHSTGERIACLIDAQTWKVRYFSPALPTMTIRKRG